MEIIPAIDIIDGKCVRLSQGDFTQQTDYTLSPLEMASLFERAGCVRLHIVDLDGARDGKPKNLKTVERIAVNTNLQIDFGGGVKTEDDVQKILEYGATFVSIGSMAVKDAKTVTNWFEDFGVESFILGADCKDEKIMIDGWKTQTDISVFDFIEQYASLGVQQFFSTDIAVDGMLQGPSIELYKKILEKFPEIILIASGGVKNMKDIETLKEINCAGVIVGKAIYEKTLPLEEVHQYNLDNILRNLQNQIGCCG